MASLIAVGMGGCESSSNLLGGGNSPAQTSLAIPTTPAPATQSAKIQIAPVIGSPENVAHDLQSQLASAIGREGLTVVTANNATGEYVVRGYIVAAREKTKSKISYIWDVTDQSGKRVHRVTGEEVIASSGKDPWSAVTPAVVQKISDKTSKQIASWVAGGGAVPVASNIKTQSTNVASDSASTPASSAKYASAASTPAPTTGSITPSGPVTAVVPMVTGAPGDGSSTLTTAIQRELTKSGLKLATGPDSQAYRVEGKVALGASSDGKQPIQIDWNVLDPTGKKLGTVSQKNEVPTGSLDGAWGKTADAAAAAAAQGIIKLLPAKAVD
ncbi:hypothetical protein [Hyphomicrobium sp.]|uniref:hypothetical protein n=1 Tax=Hyphomicrobium sp. TaxID=82 RepID=UPI0025BB7C7D|nr:hypothetical protein [Hyphomicrobium sp.]